MNAMGGKWRDGEREEDVIRYMMKLRFVGGSPRDRSQGNNPDLSDRKEWRHLERGKTEVKYFIIIYVSDVKISHLVNHHLYLEQTHALVRISLRRKEPTPHALVSRSDFCHQKWKNIQVEGPD
jgi:hypothetical protein